MGVLRVAQVMGKMNGGGVESVVMNYYRHIDRSLVQFDFFIEKNSHFVPNDEIETLGGKIIYTPQITNLFEYMGFLKQEFTKEQYMIVHSHINTLSCFSLAAAKRAGIPIRIAHSHATSGKGEPVRNVIKGALKTQANKYPTYRMACSNNAGEWLFGKQQQFYVLRNAIDSNLYQFNDDYRYELRKSLGITQDAFVLGHVGRFVKTKNHAFILQAFAYIAKELPNSYLVLVGDGELLTSIKHQAAKLGLADRVVFAGQCNETEKYYSVFDAFIMPSLYEGFGLAALEAQQSGLPCFLSTNISHEVQVLGNVHFLDLNDSPSFWADNILKNGYYIHAVRSVPGELAEKFNIGEQAKKLQNVYSVLVNGLRE